MQDFKHQNWLFTENPTIFFEDSSVGRMKKEVWDASEEEIDKILEEYGIPAESELGKAGCYIQTTPRCRQIEKRRKNDIVFVPIGCTENHGMHANSGLDTFQVTMVLEGLRRYTAKQGHEVNLAFPPILYGGHPYHHIGMPGTVIMPEEVVKETLIYTMLGLWNDGYRKIIFVNNHGHSWMLEAAIHEFCKRYQLPGIFRTVEWHRSVREFFVPVEDHADSMDTTFVHADEAETSCAKLLFPDMIDMDAAQEAWPTGYLFKDHYDNSVDSMRRPARWSEGEGHAAIERRGTPEGVVGNPKLATARKAKRPIAATLKFLTLIHDEIRRELPPGVVPPVEMTTLRTEEELAPFLKEPLSEGWKSVDQLPRIGIFEHM